ncbi:unnamed protein product, partial [Musa acuminata subsp. burmannicoides]
SLAAPEPSLNSLRPSSSSPRLPILMEKPNSWIAHVEAFVDSARASNQQAASVDAIAVLVHKDLLTLEGLVREMEQYLTASDHVIRARG